MASPPAKRTWDAITERDRWRSSLEAAKQVQDKFGNASGGASGFVLLCLAELDAGIQLLETDCFASRAAFFAEVRRLIDEPTVPSRLVASIDTYRTCQKQWLEFILKKYEQDTCDSGQTKS